MPAWINRQPKTAPRATVGLQRVPCQHPYFDRREETSYGILYYWKECLDCGKEFAHGQRENF